MLRNFCLTLSVIILQSVIYSNINVVRLAVIMYILNLPKITPEEEMKKYSAYKLR